MGVETKCDGFDNDCDVDMDEDFSYVEVDGDIVIGGIGEVCGIGVCVGGIIVCNFVGNGVVCIIELGGSNF